MDYTNEETWQLSDSEEFNECLGKYKEIKFHYIELKQFNWIDINSTNLMIDSIKSDIYKYSETNKQKLKEEYQASSIISLCLVSFYDKGDLVRKVFWKNINNKLNSIRENISKEFKGKFREEECNFLSKMITDEVCLFMLYYNL